MPFISYLHSVLSVLAVDRGVPFLACVHWPAPVSFPDSCPQGPEQPVIAVLLGVSPPLPALPSTQERQGHPSQGDRMGLKGPRPERASGTGGPPQVGEARWLVGQHPTLSCRLGRSRRVLQVLLARAPPQGRSQPRGPRQPHTHLPNPTHSWAGTLHGHTPPHWLPVLVWSYFDAMKRLC